ncbi:FkbM family methyltransferase [Prochlorococcus marinus]|uniref:FkbM family methyltransferase n=1 Tax=Prochlorococcus marinus TaxID=1219 RepID=UPI0022B38FA7|nr:FkbM family methyltransferase [Prochlorococcus marinus]
MDISKKEFINLGGFNDLIKMRYGWMVYNKNDMYIGKSIKEYGEWSQGEIDLCKQILTSSDVVIEVGSNIGSHTLALAKTVNEGVVFAFEPQNVVFQNLCANISINSITNCFCFNSALSDKKGEDFYYPNFDFTEESNFAGISLTKEKSSNVHQAKVDTLDNRFANLQRLKLLKTDAEGMEVNVLKGGFDLIKRTKPFLYVENDANYIEKSKELIELIWSLDYRIFWHIIPLYNKNNFFKNENNLFDKVHSVNILAIRKDQNIRIDLPEVKDSSHYPDLSNLIAN